MSHKRFLGWEPARTIVTDDEGVQTVTVEPEWDDQERGYMTALAAYEASLCAVCGGDPEECQGEGADRRWKGAPPSRCYKVDAITSFQEAATPPYQRPRALVWNAEKRN